MEYYKNYPDEDNENDITFLQFLAKSRSKNIRTDFIFAIFHVKKLSQTKIQMIFTFSKSKVQTPKLYVKSAQS